MTESPADGPRPDPQPERRGPALPVAALARRLPGDVSRDTLHRALRNDPSAPAQAEGPYDVPHYHLEEVLDWWPGRRRRGQRGPDRGSRTRQATPAPAPPHDT